MECFASLMVLFQTLQFIPCMDAKICPCQSIPHHSMRELQDTSKLKCLISLPNNLQKAYATMLSIQMKKTLFLKTFYEDIVYHFLVSFGSLPIFYIVDLYILKHSNAVLRNNILFEAI